MLIDLTDLLKETGNELFFNDAVPAAFPKEDIDIDGPVNISIHFINAGGAVLAKGKISADIKVNCSRCLKEFSSFIEAEIDEQCLKKPGGPKAHAKEACTEPRSDRGGVEIEDLDIFFPINDDNTMDLSELARQNLILNIPVKPLCSKDCTVAGKIERKEKTIDPRLSKLKEIINARTQKKTQ